MILSFKPTTSQKGLMACGIPLTSLNGLVSIWCGHKQTISPKSSSNSSKIVVGVWASARKWKFGDDIILREARALFRSLPNDGVWNMFAMREFFALPTACVVPSHSNADAHEIF